MKISEIAVVKDRNQQLCHFVAGSQKTADSDKEKAKRYLAGLPVLLDEILLVAHQTGLEAIKFAPLPKLNPVPAKAVVCSDISFLDEDPVDEADLRKQMSENPEIA